MAEYMRRNRIDPPDRQLACAHIRSPEGERYLSALAAAANFAFANRQLLAPQARETFLKALKLGPRAPGTFPPGPPEIPGEYRKVGQPVFIPGEMGNASYVLAGAPGAMRLSFGSTCHGGGRRMSRTQAKAGG